ncbi:MAG: hypothetical protein JWR80_8762 [Bradyrhizobium sp.]|nr:hypothetical protein [Bradyrhizobium sp.]
MIFAPASAVAGEPLTLAHADRLRPLLAASGSALSEYCVANLLLFRHRHRYRFAEQPVPHVLGVTYDGERHAMPLAPLDARIAVELLRGCDCIGPLGEEAPSLAARLGLACDWNEADSDYAYDAQRLAVLEGAKAKRAQATAFEREASPGAAALDDGNVGLAHAVLEGWFGDVGRAPAETDLDECREALALRAALGLEGLLVEVRGAPVAFLLAGPGADGNRIVHFAKGRRAWPGAYPWMFARYAATAGVARINFEQDLGNPGFAQAKRALAPAARLRKYRLRRA